MNGSRPLIAHVHALVCRAWCNMYSTLACHEGMLFRSCIAARGYVSWILDFQSILHAFPCILLKMSCSRHVNQLEIIKLISPMKLTGIYRVLRFNQSRSVAQALHVLISILQLSGGKKGSPILRRISSSLWIIQVFGETMENLRKRARVDLVTPNEERRMTNLVTIVRVIKVIRSLKVV